MYSENDDDEDYNENIENSSKFSKLKDLYESNKKIVWIVGGLVLLLMMLLMMKGCSGNGGSPLGGRGKEPSITLASTKETLGVGNSVQIIATIHNGENDLVIWNSSDVSVATVDQLGNVNAIKLGTTTISATYRHSNGKDYVATCEIKVILGDENITVTDVSFPEGELLIARGDKFVLLKQVTPSNGFISDISYSSSNESVVKVESNGEINALSVGVSTITMKVNGNIFTDELIVNVTDRNVEPQMITNPTAINFDKKEITVMVGKNENLTYQYIPSVAYLYDAVWESSDTSVATVENTGTVYGVKEGTAVVTIKTRNDLQSSITIKVIPDVIKVTSLSLSSSSNLTLNIGDTSTIVPNVMPYNATDKTVSYTSSNSSVVGVDQQGLIRAISAGSANIEVKTNDQGMTAMVSVTVKSNISDGGYSGGGSSGGSSCSSGDFVTITSNSSSLTSNGSGSLSTNSSGNTSTITKGTNLEIKVSSLNCSNVTSFEYCAHKLGASCSRSSFKQSDTVKVTLPSGSGVYQISIYGHTSDGGTIVKDYYTKYNISGGTTTPTTGCYCCGNSQGCTYNWGNGGPNCSYQSNMTQTQCTGTNRGAETTSSSCYKDTTINSNVWGNFDGQSRYVKQSYTTESACLYGTSTSWKMIERKYTLFYGDINYGTVSITARSTIKKLYYCITEADASSCSIDTSKSSYASINYGGTSPYSEHALLKRGETYARDYSTTSINFKLGAWDSQRFCFIAKYADGNLGTSSCIKTVTN